MRYVFSLGSPLLLVLYFPVVAFAEGQGEAFVETFEILDETRWRVAEHTVAARFNQTSWSADYVSHAPGTLTLRFEDSERNGKPYTGSEIKTRQKAHYGRYEVTMRPSGTEGVLSAFFVYTGPHFGDPVSEIDFEFKGEDTTKVLLTYHTPEGSDGEFVDLGFDASLADRNYAFEWEPDRIRWYVDDVLLREVEAGDVGLPATAGQIYMSVWSGASDFTGIPQDGAVGEAHYSRVAFIPREEPVALPDQAYVEAGQNVQVDVLKNDSSPSGEIDPTSVEIITPPEIGHASVLPDGRILYEAPQDSRGLQVLSYRVSDGANWSNRALLTLTVDMPVVEAFTTDRGGFHYSDSAFQGATAHDQAEPYERRGTIGVALGSGDITESVEGISGGWSRSFTLSKPKRVLLDLDFRLNMARDFANSAKAMAIATIGNNDRIIASLEVDGSGQRADTGEQSEKLDLGIFEAGNHTLTLGGYLSRRTSPDERAFVSFDAVSVELHPVSVEDEVMSTQTQIQGETPIAIPKVPLLEEEFLNGSSSFSFEVEPSNLATGSVSDGALHTTFPAMDDTETSRAIRGMWSAPIEVEPGQAARITVRHRIEAETDDAARQIAAFVSIGDQILPLSSSPRGPDGPFTETVLDLEELDAGQQTVSLGASLLKANENSSDVRVSFDDIIVDLVPLENTNGPKLTVPDPWLDEEEAQLAAVIVSGLRRESSSLVILSDGISDIVHITDSNGAIPLDLSSLRAGPISSEMIITDAGGQSRRIAGPPMRLLKGSGDDDGNLGLTNARLWAEENGKVSARFDLLGLDTDATATISVTDGSETATQVSAVDGPVVVALDNFEVANLKTQVEAVDAFGNSSVVDGPELILDLDLVSDHQAAN